MNLVEVVNTITAKSVGHFIVCDGHLPELKKAHHPGICNVRHITSDFNGECQFCVKGPTQEIIYDHTPESFNILATFEDGSESHEWSASGQNGKIHYIMDNNNNIYNSQEGLYRAGVRKLHILTGVELHLDLDLEED